MVKDGLGVYIEKLELLRRPFQPNGPLGGMVTKVLLFYFFEGLVKNGHVVCGQWLQWEGASEAGHLVVEFGGV